MKRESEVDILSLSIFRLLSSPLLLFPQRFGWYVLRRYGYKRYYRFAMSPAGPIA